MNKCKWILSNYCIIAAGLLLCQLMPCLVPLILGDLSLSGYLSALFSMLLPCAVLAAVITLIWFFLVC